MLTLPDEYNTLLATFRPHFSKRLWPLARLLLTGALLAPGKRTVTAVLRIMGLSQERHFQNYHRVLNRAVWSNLALSASLLPLLLRTFLPQGPVVLGIDETLERRRGAKIRAKGIYRDPVRTALGQPAAAGADPLGWAGLGAALFDGPGPVGPVL